MEFRWDTLTKTLLPARTFKLNNISFIRWNTGNLPSNDLKMGLKRLKLSRLQSKKWFWIDLNLVGYRVKNGFKST